jgi:hypothetical protein
MSEFQRIAFRAIDGPVSEKNLKYMEQQSSRAEITPWQFDNEYQWGDFRGNAEEMLRRGYDLHLHYANFGIRNLLIRLPQGLPDLKAAQSYLAKDTLRYVKDKAGAGGILSIDPYIENGQLDELWELDDLIDRLIPLRAEILEGDLRPLYLAHLAIVGDGNHGPDEMMEGPVPAGLTNLTDAQQALADFYGFSDGFLAAVAEASPPLPSNSTSDNSSANWLRAQPAETKDRWLADWMTDPHSIARREMLTQFQKSRGAPTWLTASAGRTISQLRVRAEELAAELNRKASEKSAREKAARLAQIAADPEPTLRETETLLKVRSLNAYESIAKLLAELRESLAGSDRSDLAEQQARKLKQDNPRLRNLTAALRRKGFVPK